MRYLCLVVVVLVVAASAQKAKKVDVEVLEARCRRGEDTVTIDGKVRIAAEKGLKGLVLAFDFIGDSGNVLTTQKSEVSEDVMDKGDEPSFHVETNNPPGSIKYSIRALDGEGRDLRTGNSGPFVIE